MTEKTSFERTNLLAATLLVEPECSHVSISNPAARVIHSRLAKLTQKISSAEEAEQEVKPVIPD